MDSENSDENLRMVLKAFLQSDKDPFRASDKKNEPATTPEHIHQASTTDKQTRQIFHHHRNKTGPLTSDMVEDRSFSLSNISSQPSPFHVNSVAQAATEIPSKDSSRKRQSTGNTMPSQKPVKRRRQADPESNPKSTGTPHSCINSMAMAAKIFNDKARRFERQMALERRIVVWAPRRHGGFLALSEGQDHTRDISDFNVRPKAMAVWKSDPLRGFQSTQSWVRIDEPEDSIEEWFIKSTDDMKSHFKAFVDLYASPEGKAKCLRFYKMGEEAVERIMTQPPPRLVADASPQPQTFLPLTQGGSSAALDVEPAKAVSGTLRKVSKPKPKLPSDNFTPSPKIQMVRGQTQEVTERWSFIRNNPIIGYVWKVKNKFCEYPPNLEAAVDALKNWLRNGSLERRQDFTSWAATFETTERGSAQITEFTDDIPRATFNVVQQSVENEAIHPAHFTTGMTNRHQVIGQVEHAAMTPGYGTPLFASGPEEVGFGSIDPALLTLGTTSNFGSHQPFEPENAASMFDRQLEFYNRSDAAIRALAQIACGHIGYPGYTGDSQQFGTGYIDPALLTLDTSNNLGTQAQVDLGPAYPGFSIDDYLVCPPRPDDAQARNRGAWNNLDLDDFFTLPPSDYRIYDGVDRPRDRRRFR